MLANEPRRRAHASWSLSLGAFLALSALSTAGAYDLPGGWSLEGSIPLNLRFLGPGRHSNEVEIETELFLPGVVFGVEGPAQQGLPLKFELATDEKGSLKLSQAIVAYRKVGDFELGLGKFLLPYGRYNQLYRSADHLTITHPLLYADPRNLDVLSRINHARPVVSVGYSDVGLFATYYPRPRRAWYPRRVTFFVVNGLGENAERGRTFPSPALLEIPPTSPNGLDIDFEHRGVELRDSNDIKVPGGRLEFGLGGIDLSRTLPEGMREVHGAQLGLSLLGPGKYDLDKNLNYYMLGADLSLQREDFSLTGELQYSLTQFRSPLITSVTSSTSTPTFISVDLPRKIEVNWGYYLQATFPVPRPAFLDAWGGRWIGVLAANWMRRIGPELESVNGQAIINGQQFFQFNAIRGGTVKKDAWKFTQALAYKVTPTFTAKAEVSQWLFQSAKWVYQTALSAVLQF